MVTVKPDADARAAILHALDETLVIEAAAGTGKTTELVKRILRVLATGRATMGEIVAVTFTEKAAGELKLRLREALELERARAAGAAVADRLDAALERLEEAHVNTIHGFCADLLRERPVEASVDPVFAVLTEPQAGALYDRAFRAWLEGALEQPSEGLRRALRRSAGAAGGTDDGSDGPIDRLRRAGRALAEWRDCSAPWRRPPFDRHAEIDRLIASLHQLAAISAAPSWAKDNLFVDTDGVRRLSRQIDLEQSGGRPDYDGWEARLVDLLRNRGFSRTRKGSGHKYGKNATRSEVLAARDRLFAAVLQFRKDADADLAAALQPELAGATARYQSLKAAAGVLDFADLLARARDLIKSNIAVRRHLQAKFTHIFVDEFQDTDPVQSEILLLLAADDAESTDWTRVRPVPGKLFLVGDPKQAIYRFRGTDVGTYRRVAKQLASHGGRVLQLTTSYRSLPAIQRFVNAAFEQEMQENDQTLQAGYVPLAPDRDSDGSQPAIVALPVPRPYGERGLLRASAKAIEASLPDVIGAFIAWIVDEAHGWHVTEPGANGAWRRVPIRPQHVAVLFRRFVSFGEDLTRRYVDAIEARGVPHLLVGGKAFHDREEVETIRAALEAIEWPDDELSVFATLKGSLFAIDDAHLLEFRHRFGSFHPFRVPKALGGNTENDLELTGEPTAHLAPIADALRLLQRLHRGRNYRPVADTIGRLLADTRAHVGFILRPAGEQALANVLHVAELARQYEARGGISFRGFIAELSAASEAETAEAPILEESSDGVRLMTVHKAKGLEFPVVILADLTCRLSRADATRYVDPGASLCAMKIGGWAPHELHDHEAEEVARDQAEGVRLAYVAATRARDLLVVPALGDEPWEGGWLAPLNRALYPPVAARRTPGRGPKCPAFKSKDSVLQRPDDEPAGAGTVAPGAHAFADQGYSVVWWEPGPGGGLTLGVKPPFGVRRDDLIVRDVARHVVADGRSRYDSWCLARSEARTFGAAASLTVHPVRDWVSASRPVAHAGESRVPIDIVNAAAFPAGDRAGGLAFGALVHLVLAQAPFDSSTETLEAVASVQARILGLGDGDARAAARAVERVFAHDVLRRARSADLRGACRRETAVTWNAPDGALVEGFVDLAFEESGRWIVVEYKTDRELAAAGEDRYLRQLDVYCTAVARATGRPASGILLRL
jgi:ATP-dependent exoDNAse (exonuclease V) beta subunit